MCVVIVFLSCEDSQKPSELLQPRFPLSSKAGGSVCNMLRMSDFVLLATPITIGKPYELSLSPWPDEKGWVTPIDWKVDKVLATRPLPGKIAPTLPSSISTVIGEAFKPTGQTVLGITRVDSVWLFSEYYVVSASGWTSEAELTIYKSINELSNVVQATSLDPKCNRNFDVMEDTRAANVQRVAEYEAAKLTNPTMSVPTPSLPSGP